MATAWSTPPRTPTTTASPTTASSDPGPCRTGATATATAALMAARMRTATDVSNGAEQDHRAVPTRLRPTLADADLDVPPEREGCQASHRGGGPLGLRVRAGAAPAVRGPHGRLARHDVHAGAATDRGRAGLATGDPGQECLHAGPGRSQHHPGGDRWWQHVSQLAAQRPRLAGRQPAGRRHPRLLGRLRPRRRARRAHRGPPTAAGLGGRHAPDPGRAAGPLAGPGRRRRPGQLGEPRHLPAPPPRQPVGLPDAAPAASRRLVEVAIRAVARDKGARFGTIYDRVCTYDPCPLVQGEILMWRDSSHLTRTIVEQLTPSVREMLAPTIGTSGLRRGRLGEWSAGRSASGAGAPGGLAIVTVSVLATTA